MSAADSVRDAALHTLFSGAALVADWVCATRL